MNKPKYNLKSAVNSLNHNVQYRPNALGDIESDLESALKAVKELIAAEAADHNAVYDAGKK